MDEISELPLNLQVKLLQVIQDREFTRVGGVNRIPVDVRIISATNKDLHLLVKSGKFREDLYYRLNVVPINVPPLRERPEDILPLIQSNLEKYNNQLGENKTLEPAALAVLLHYSWPGNIRELQNIVERLILTTRDNLITEENLPVFIRTSAEAQPVQSMEHTSLRASMERAEKEVLTRALAEYKSTRAIAKALQVSQPTIVRKLHKYGLTQKRVNPLLTFDTLLYQRYFSVSRSASFKFQYFSLFSLFSLHFDTFLYRFFPFLFFAFQNSHLLLFMYTLYFSLTSIQTACLFNVSAYVFIASPNFAENSAFFIFKFGTLIAHL